MHVANAKAVSQSGAVITRWRRLISAKLLRDGAIRSVVAIWFFGQATIYATDIANTIKSIGSNESGGVDGAVLIARTCLFFYFSLVTWATLVRPAPVVQAPGWRPRVIAMFGAYAQSLLPFVAPQPDLGLLLNLLSSILLVAGNVLGVVILMRLGRSFSIMAEARRLVTTGPYAIVRHPLYLAEQLALTGCYLQFASWPAAALYAAQVLCQFQRMRNEEAVLRRAFPEYAAYVARTPRLIPGVW